MSWGVLVKVFEPKNILVLTTDLAAKLSFRENVIFEAEFVKLFRCLSYQVDI